MNEITKNNWLKILGPAAAEHEVVVPDSAKLIEFSDMETIYKARAENVKEELKALRISADFLKNSDTDYKVIAVQRNRTGNGWLFLCES